MPRRPADVDHLAQHVRPVGLQHHRLLGAVVASSRASAVACASMPTASMHFSRPLAGGQLVEPLDHALLVEIDRDRAAGARPSTGARAPGRSRSPGWRRAEGAADRQLADRPAAPDRDRVARLDVALGRRLPAGREDVARGTAACSSERPSGTLMGADVGERHAHVLGLAAGIAAGEMRVAEQAGRWRGRTPCRPVSLLRLVRSQTEKLPRRHCSHSPQKIVNGTTTRSPILSCAFAARRPRRPRP